MKLLVKERESQIKKDAKRVRREGSIPAVVYSSGQANRRIVVRADEFHTHLRHTQKGHLSSKKFKLEDEKGQSVQAIVKEIQYHPTTYNILHIDFLELKEDKEININIPLSLKGTADCAGVKLGGVIRPVLRYLKVKCLPKNIPDTFEINVVDMKLNQSRRLSSINLPDNVRPLMNLNEVAVIIAKR
ncbi:MAG: 50S ribosomal protein L25 [Chlamydiae bacterium]|nr:50S ribosomal protein L25 [Chlamydiota bacterium]